MSDVWRRCWPALATVLIGLLLAWTFVAAPLGEEIERRSEARLSDDAGWARLAVRGRDITVTGTAPSADAPGRVLHRLAEIPGVRIVRNRSAVPPLVTPFTFTMARAEGGVELSGHVPSPKSREQLTRAAGTLAADVVDRTSVARGAPEGFDQIALFAAAQLAALSEGAFFLSDASLSIRGSSRNRVAYDSLIAALSGRIPGGGEIAGLEIAPPLVSPFGWRADLAGARLALTGHVASPEIEAAMEAQARDSLPGIVIENRLLPARGEPQGFATAVAFALAQLFRLETGAVAVVDDEISIKGTARDFTAFGAVRGAMEEGAPAGFRLVLGEISPPVVDAYTWSATLESDQVVFDGFAPSEEARRLIETVAIRVFPDRTIVDRTRLATGVPTGFADLTEFALERLADLGSGTVQLADKALSVVGVARDSEAYEAAQAALQRAMPAGGTLAVYDVSPPLVSPYRWAVDYDGATVRMRGFVPSVRMRLAARDALEEAFPDTPIADLTDLADGAPDGFGELVLFAAEQLAALQAGEVELTDTALSIRGLAESPPSYAELKRQLERGLPGNARLERAEISPPSIVPFTWQAKLGEGKLTIEGYVPSAEDRSRVLARVGDKFPETPIADESLVASGAPQHFVDLVEFALARLSELTEGRAGLAGTNLSVAGAARDPEQFSRARAALAGPLPAGATVAAADITPPVIEPYRWRARLDGSGITMEGFVPGDAVRDTITASIETIFPDAPLADNLQYGAGAPNAFPERVAFALTQLGRLDSGSVGWSGDSLSLTGSARDPDAYAALSDALQDDLPAGVTLAENGVAPAPVSPYVWRYASADGTSTLSGYAPDLATRADISIAARDLAGEGPLEDTLKVASGAPLGFDNAVRFALRIAERLEAADLRLEGGRAIFSGEARSPEDYEVVVAALRTPPDGFSVDAAELRSAVVAPYVLTGEIDAEGASLTGYAPDFQTREMIINAAARLPGTAETDMLVAEGAPPGLDFEAAAVFAVAQLGRIGEGKVELAGGALTIEGRARDPDAFDAINRALAGVLPAGMTVAAATIGDPVASPYTVKLERVGGGLVLTGYAPDNATRDIILEMADLRFSGTPVAEQLKIARGEPRNFLAAINVGLQAASRLDGGKMELEDVRLSVRGDALYDAAAEEVAEQIRATLPPGFDGELAIGVAAEPQLVTEDRCLEDIAEILTEGRILFEASSAEIREESFGLLDRITYLARRCPMARFEIAGHTDADGPEDLNQALSEERANAVAQYLTRAGIAANRLTAIGYGESQPIADNETDEGKARNRRITFSLRRAPGDTEGG